MSVCLVPSISLISHWYLLLVFYAVECLWLLLSTWEKEEGSTWAVWYEQPDFASWSLSAPFIRTPGHLCCDFWHDSVGFIIITYFITSLTTTAPSHLQVSFSFCLFWRCSGRVPEWGVNWSLYYPVCDCFKRISLWDSVPHCVELFDMILFSLPHTQWLLVLQLILMDWFSCCVSFLFNLYLVQDIRIWVTWVLL